MTYPIGAISRATPALGRAASFVEVVSSAQAKISTAEEKTGLASDAVLQELATARACCRSIAGRQMEIDRACLCSIRRLTSIGMGEYRLWIAAAKIHTPMRS